VCEAGRLVGMITVHDGRHATKGRRHPDERARHDIRGPRLLFA
jgi:hypothetical protein